MQYTLVLFGTMTTAKKHISAYVDQATRDWLLSQARAEKRSLSQWLAMRLKAWAEDERSKDEGK